MVTYFSGFAGIGGFDEGIRRVLPSAICTGYSEVDKHAIKIYEKHFPDRTNYGDITKIKAKTLPDFDMFCGGFPCPDFSKAGKRAGLRGARGGLFFEIIRLLRKKKPELVFLENVEGILSSNKGWDFARILIELADIGYFCEWDCLNSADYGVPQSRKRVFIIGHSGKGPGSKVFPLRENDLIPDEQTIEERVQQNAHCLRGRDYANWNGNFITRCLTGGGKSGGLHSDMTLLRVGSVGDGNAETNRVYDPAGISRTLKGSSGGWGNATGLYCISDSGLHRTSQVYTDTIPPLRANTGCSHNNVIVHNMHPRCGDPGKGGTGHLSKDDGNSYCLDNNPQVIESHTQIRRLTPLEAERLQGFEDNWTAGIADSHRYRLLGNAVTVPVISAIMEKIVKVKGWR